MAVLVTGDARFPERFKYKTVKVKDALTTNLLSRVPECIAFIDEYVPVAVIVVASCLRV